MQKQRAIAYSSEEIEHYNKLYSQVNPYNQAQVDGKAAASFLMKIFGIEKEVIKKVWVISSIDGQNLNKEGFFRAFRLCYHLRQGIEVSMESLNASVHIDFSAVTAQPRTNPPKNDMSSLQAQQLQQRK